MVDTPLVFPDIGNALASGAHARYYGQQSDLAAAEERRRAAAEPYVGAAMQGDPTAMARVAAGDPKTAVAVSTALARMDADQRAKTKEQGEYTATAANAILQADPKDRADVYRQMYGEGIRRGYKMSLPPEYSPALDGVLRGHRATAQSINEYFKSQEGTPVPLGGGSAPAGPPMPGGGGGPYGGAIANIESSGAPGGGYGAVGPPANDKGNRAYGKYQVMDFNVGPWTQEVLGKPMTPQEFAANPQAQDAVFNAKFGQYVQKYGSPQAAARAWFAGEGGMSNPNATDVNGMSVANYERKFSAGLPAGGQAAPTVPGPIVSPPVAQIPGPPQGLVPPGALPAQMPGPPTGLTPPGPPPAQMPNGMPPQIAQGSGGDGSGNPVPPVQQALPPETQSANDFLKRARPGWQFMGSRQTGEIAYDKQGRALVLGPNGERDAIKIPEPAQPTFGWQQQGGQLAPVLGGPNDPETIRREAQARGTPGYQPSPSGVGLAPITGGPADPDVLTRNAEAKRIAAEKAIPQTVTKGMQENVNSLKQLDRVEAELNKNKDSVGGVGSTAASIIPGVGALQNRFGDPQGTQLRALIADIGSMKIHDRSGAAVTASEFPRLKPFIPSISDDAATIRSKLANFRAEYTSLLADTASYYGPENGFRAYTPATDYLEGKTKGEPGKPAAGAAPAPPANAQPAGGSLKLPPKPVPTFNSPEEAARMPSGTQFRTPDGRMKVVP